MWWCIGSILVGLLLVASGIGLTVKVDVPHIGVISGSIGAVLTALGFIAGIMGLCVF